MQSVPADEGFWVGTSENTRIWVQLVGNQESPYTLRDGDRVSFTGTITKNNANFIKDSGLSSAEGADLLRGQGVHLQVQKNALKPQS